MIVVFGATGTVGSELVRLLVAAGAPVRAVTRDPGGARVPAGAQVARADFADAGSLTAALHGATAVFLLAPPGPAQAEQDLAMIAAARAAGVRRAVKLSAIGTGLASHPRLGEWHLPGEQALQASGLAWTILRPTTFASNMLYWADAIRAGEGVPDPFGGGGQGVVDPADVAVVAARVLTADDHDGQVYTLTGPALLTLAEQVAIIGAAVDRPATTVPVSTADNRAQLLAAGSDPAYVEKIIEGTNYVRDGHNAVLTDDVKRVTGRPPGTFAAWVDAHRAAFA